MRIKHRRALGAVAAVAAAVAVAAPAGAATVPLSGTQTVVDENAGTFKMHGSLVGDWAITTFNVLDTAPLLHAKGTERFSGCLDRGRDGSCKGDPSGTLRFTIDYSALFDPRGSQNLVWGACLHPVTGGTGAFAGRARRARDGRHADRERRQHVVHRQPDARRRQGAEPRRPRPRVGGVRPAELRAVAETARNPALRAPGA